MDASLVLVVRAEGQSKHIQSKREKVMSELWCDRDKHEFDDPDDPDAYCTECCLSIAQATRVGQLENLLRACEAEGYGPDASDRTDNQICRALAILKSRGKS